MLPVNILVLGATSQYLGTWCYLSISWYLVLPVNILVLGAASQYLDGFLESNSRNCDETMAVIVVSSGGLHNLERKDARCCELLYVVIYYCM